MAKRNFFIKFLYLSRRVMKKSVIILTRKSNVRFSDKVVLSLWFSKGRGGI